MSFEESLSFLEGSFCIGIGVDEDVHMVESGDEFDVRREEHSISEDVAGHIAYADNGERCFLGIDSHIAKVSFDGFPRTSSGDSHFFVVVSLRAA